MKDPGWRRRFKRMAGEFFSFRVSSSAPGAALGVVRRARASWVGKLCLAYAKYHKIVLRDFCGDEPPHALPWLTSGKELCSPLFDF